MMAAALVIALAAWAGNWQSGRALEKDESEARIAVTRDAVEVQIGPDLVDGAALEGRRVVARGEYVAPATIYWDNRMVGGVAGMAVVTPLRLAGGTRVLLVDRGLVRLGADRNVLPAVATPAGVVEVRGRAYVAPRRTLELKDNADTGQLWQNLTPEKFTARTGLAAQPILLRQGGDGAAEGLRRAPEQPEGVATGMTAAKHRGYAFQWYSLSLLALALFLFFTFFQHDNPSRDP